MRRLIRTAFIGFGWPLLVLTSALGLQGPLSAHIAQPVKAIKSWTAVASWYGPEFNGRTTASGQTYDMFAPTAAHPWLPFGSIVRVINLSNGRSQLVRINDRGPNMPNTDDRQTDDRQLDVSFLAAARLGLLESGLAKVRIDLMEEPKRP